MYCPPHDLVRSSMVVSSSPHLSEGDEDHRSCEAPVKRLIRKLFHLRGGFVTACQITAYGAPLRDNWKAMSAFSPLRPPPHRFNSTHRPQAGARAPIFLGENYDAGSSREHLEQKLYICVSHANTAITRRLTNLLWLPSAMKTQPITACPGNPACP